MDLENHSFLVKLIFQALFGRIYVDLLEGSWIWMGYSDIKHRL